MSSELLNENKELRRRLQALMTHARNNEHIMYRQQVLELRIIGVSGLRELLHEVLCYYKKAADLDNVTLVLVDPEYEIQRMLSHLDVVPGTFPGLCFLENDASFYPLFDGGFQPVLGLYRPETHGGLFAAPVGLHSVALLPLVRNQQLIGALSLGSISKGRFISGMATDFIARLGAIVAICLENVINSERLKHMGLTDPLTGIRNRRYFENRLPEEVARTQRYRHSLACLFLDVDYFKRINDAHGHQNGDIVLREVAGRIQGELRGADCLVRYGGEEFAILLAQVDETEAVATAERIRQVIAEQPFSLENGIDISVTLSVGVSILRDWQEIADLTVAAHRLVEVADQALYRAKAGGRNQVVDAGDLSNAVTYPFAG
ncbi:MAG TPA: diguanylate cyclase [Betaproteobacteria bacterium]|nr:diguanylate cyclase [Betaproteobacteria bacterium]